MKEVVAFDVFLHFGTLLSIVIFFRKEIFDMLFKDRTMARFILIACVPTFIIGMLFKDSIDSLFMNIKLVGISLVVTGAFLLAASLVAYYRVRSGKPRPIGVLNSVVIGIAQGIAVVPGISRSGSTIGTALIAGVGAAESLKFSFLLAMPAILGANLLKAGDICGNLVSMDAVPYAAGFLAAAVSGIIAIKLLFGILKKNLLYLFGIYCILVGSAVALFIR
jgi:undecaprenyl-diphosphatase